VAALFGGRVFEKLDEYGDALGAALRYIDGMRTVRVEDSSVGRAPERLETWIELSVEGRPPFRRAWFIAPVPVTGWSWQPRILNRLVVLAGKGEVRPELVGRCGRGEELSTPVPVRLPMEARERLRPPVSVEFEYAGEEWPAGSLFVASGAVPRRMTSMSHKVSDVFCLPVRSPFPGRRFRTFLLDGGGEWAYQVDGRFDEQGKPEGRP
jgi:hypothetical protein